MFVTDLLAPRSDSPVTHTITALGSSSTTKGDAFVQKHWSIDKPRPQVFEGYEPVYRSPDVDIVYVGTPHTVHKQNCLDAIAAGKHVLCEKPFAVNAKDAQQVIDAARAKGVFIMEGMCHLHP